MTSSLRFLGTFNLPAQAVMACALTCGLAPLAGCDEAQPDDDTELRGLSYDCPRWRCGYNTSEVNGKSLQELHLGGLANADGVKLVGFFPPAGLLLNWTLTTEGDALVARGGLFGKGKLRGHALVGSILLLRVESNLLVPVVIAGYEEVDSWATDGAPQAAYALIYPDLAQPLLQKSVCKGSLIDPLQASVVILAGERYDLETKTVIPNQSNWITLACAGSAAAKMALLGYGPHANFDDSGAPASPAQRQATLKMITADYCGDGLAYTVDGTELIWENQSGTVVPTTTSDLSAPEAIWTDAGALCLDVPRAADPSEVACALPSCDSLSLDDGEWASYAVWGN
ncbi:hypothetical protein DB30_01827 [Enhygromyxa salina]|uniref:ADYC domain-containing protein n=1 Tax=Enhygromyxa salina TaxID=215803 RepID=A0A0C2CLS8_9BACT|nr:ADYC domain-containing protein [Enhygromyxa salina]KIG12191.1 hypothetical protein DB30_01827 [Enhygromyxa salina]